MVVVGECDIYKEERDVLEKDMRKIDQCGMEKFGTLDSSEKSIAFLGDGCGHRRRNSKGIT